MTFLAITTSTNLSRARQRPRPIRVRRRNASSVILDQYCHASCRGGGPLFHRSVVHSDDARVVSYPGPEVDSKSSKARSKNVTSESRCPLVAPGNLRAYSVRSPVHRTCDRNSDGIGSNCDEPMNLLVGTPTKRTVVPSQKFRSRRRFARTLVGSAVISVICATLK